MVAHKSSAAVAPAEANKPDVAAPQDEVSNFNVLAAAAVNSSNNMITNVGAGADAVVAVSVGKTMTSPNAIEMRV